MRGSTRASIDWTLILLYVILVGFGLSNIYASVFDPEHSFLFDLSTEYGKQSMWIGISIFLGLVILLLDASFIIKNAYIVYGVTMLLLLFVLFTKPVNGAKSWFGFGGVGIQPSEFAKIGVSLALARYLSMTSILKKKKSQGPVNLSLGGAVGGLSNFLKLYSRIIFIIGIPSILVLLQPDAGTFIVFTSFLLVLYREGYAGNILLFGLVAVIIAVITLVVADNSFYLPFTKIKLGGKFGIFIFIMVLGGILGFVINKLVLKRNRKPLYKALIGSIVVSIIFINFVEVGYSKILQKHQKERIDLVLGKIDDPDGKGYNINRAKAAIGSGGFSGVGYKQAKLANANQKHVPMQSTDFIFCTWSEERGFIGSAGLVVLYMILLIKIIAVAEKQRSIFSRVYGYAIAGIIFYHFMINIGMAIGLAPVIGIPLPFFSYGGSSMMSFTIMLFILIKLDAENKNMLS
ncbi:MAG: rod shape-determining protein RodA [Putridiphycobacter sp.]